MWGFNSVPVGQWPAMNDPRVDAVVALAPDGDIWGANYGGAAELTVPALIMAGTSDPYNPPDIAAAPIYERLGSTRKSLAVFEGAGHFIFMNSCEPWMIAGEISNLCSDPVWDMEQAHTVIDSIVTAFLLAELYSDADAAAALAPDAVSFPGVTYQASAY